VGALGTLWGSLKARTRTIGKGILSTPRRGILHSAGKHLFAPGFSWMYFANRLKRPSSISHKGLSDENETGMGMAGGRGAGGRVERKLLRWRLSVGAPGCRARRAQLTSSTGPGRRKSGSVFLGGTAADNARRDCFLPVGHGDGASPGQNRALGSRSRPRTGARKRSTRKARSESGADRSPNGPHSHPGSGLHPGAHSLDRHVGLSPGAREHSAEARPKHFADASNSHHYGKCRPDLDNLIKASASRICLLKKEWARKTSRVLFPLSCHSESSCPVIPGSGRDQEPGGSSIPATADSSALSIEMTMPLCLPRSYPTRFLPVQILHFFIYLNSRNEAILKKLSDSLATTNLD